MADYRTRAVNKSIRKLYILLVLVIAVILRITYFVRQVVDEIYDKFAASKMGIDSKGQVVLMIHCGSRGFGHQVSGAYFPGL